MPSKQYSDEELLAMPHSQIYALRDEIKDQAEQNRVAGYEHRAFARESTTEHPERLPGTAILTVGRTALKAVGLEGGRSEASFSQMAQGLTGVAEGFAANSEVIKAVKAVPWERIWQKTTDVVKATGEAIEGSLPWQKTWTREEVNKLNTEPSRPLEEVSTKLSVQDILPKLISAESSGRHVDAKTGKLLESPKGAKGITQVMPKTAKNPGYGVKPMKDDSEEEYIRFTTDYVTALHKKFEGDWEKTLAAYNWGVGKVATALGKAERFGQDWKEHLPKETKDYLAKILGKDSK